MGIIQKIKDFFTKKIKIDENNTSLIVPYNFQDNMLALKGKLEVPANHCFFLVNKKKVYDQIEEGTHEVSAYLFPKFSKRYIEISEAKKKKRKYKARSFFVNKNEIKKFEVSSYRSCVYIREDKSVFKVTFKTSLDFVVQDPREFLKNMLKEFGNPKKYCAEGFINEILSEYMTDKLQRQRFLLDEFSNSDPKIVYFLTNLAKNILASIGVQLNNLVIDDLSIKIKKKKEKVLKRKEEKLVEEKLSETDQTQQTTEDQVFPNTTDDEVKMYDDEQPATDETKKDFVNLDVIE